MGGGGLAGSAAVFGGDHFGDPFWRSFAAADFDERARDRADHIVEEAVAFDVDGDDPSPGLRPGVGMEFVRAERFREGGRPPGGARG